MNVSHNAPKACIKTRVHCVLEPYLFVNASELTEEMHEVLVLVGAPVLGLHHHELPRCDASGESRQHVLHQFLITAVPQYLHTRGNVTEHME
jgi:hypothetical protein